jgi:hypothetical protein
MNFKSNLVMNAKHFTQTTLSFTIKIFYDIDVTFINDETTAYN